MLYFQEIVTGFPVGTGEEGTVTAIVSFFDPNMDGSRDFESWAR